MPISKAIVTPYRITFRADTRVLVHCRVYIKREFYADKVRLRVQAGPFPFQNKQVMN